jgi:hypothetical protein
MMSTTRSGRSFKPLVPVEGDRETMVDEETTATGARPGTTESAELIKMLIQERDTRGHTHISFQLKDVPS